MKRQPNKLEQFAGVWERVFWRNDDGDFVIGSVADGTTVKGNIEDETELIPGVRYVFWGRWQDHPQHGKSFTWSHFVKKEPHSRQGLIKYLAKYTKGIGRKRASDIYDAFRADAVMKLRNDPQAVADAVPGLSVKVAREAAVVLQRMSVEEDTRIELVELLDGRGFPGRLYDLLIAEWGLKAAERIKRDPFVLMVKRFPGAGFLRCDRLFLDLGGDPRRLKRQTLALWHCCHTDSSGHTWIPWSVCIKSLNQVIAGARVDGRKAVRLGVRGGRLAARKFDNQLYLADAKRASNEEDLAECVAALLTRNVPSADESPEGKQEVFSGASHVECNSTTIPTRAATGETIPAAG